jgi:hypothetical protein
MVPRIRGASLNSQDVTGSCHSPRKSGERAHHAHEKARGGAAEGNVMEQPAYMKMPTAECAELDDLLSSGGRRQRAKQSVGLIRISPSVCGGQAVSRHHALLVRIILDRRQIILGHHRWEVVSS